jgi:hypothetical protein
VAAVVVASEDVVTPTEHRNIPELLFPSFDLISFFSVQNLLWRTEESFTNLPEASGLMLLFLLKDEPITAGILCAGAMFTSATCIPWSCDADGESPFQNDGREDVLVEGSLGRVSGFRVWCRCLLVPRSIEGVSMRTFYSAMRGDFEM